MRTKGFRPKKGRSTKGGSLSRNWGTQEGLKSLFQRSTTGDTYAQTRHRVVGTARMERNGKSTPTGAKARNARASLFLKRVILAAFFSERVAGSSLERNGTESLRRSGTLPMQPPAVAETAELPVHLRADPAGATVSEIPRWKRVLDVTLVLLRFAILAASDALADGLDQDRFTGACFLSTRTSRISHDAFHDFQVSNHACERGDANARRIFCATDAG